MTETSSGDGDMPILVVLGWIVLMAGLAILAYEFLQGEGLSLVGAGIVVAGGAVVWAEGRKNEPEASGTGDGDR